MQHTDTPTGYNSFLSLHAAANTDKAQRIYFVGSILLLALALPFLGMILWSGYYYLSESSVDDGLKFIMMLGGITALGFVTNVAIPVLLVRWYVSKRYPTYFVEKGADGVVRFYGDANEKQVVKVIRKTLKQNPSYQLISGEDCLNAFGTPMAFIPGLERA